MTNTHSLNFGYHVIFPQNASITFSIPTTLHIKSVLSYQIYITNEINTWSKHPLKLPTKERGLSTKSCNFPIKGLSSG
jgi:hypothetical protein